MVSCTVDLPVLQTVFPFDSLTDFTPFAFRMILSGGKVCILKTDLFREVWLAPFLYVMGVLDICCPQMISPQTWKLETILVFSLVFCGVRVWAWLSGVLCFHVWRLQPRCVSQACSLTWDLTGERFASKLTGCWHYSGCQMGELSFFPGFSWRQSSAPCHVGLPRRVS